MNSESPDGEKPKKKSRRVITSRVKWTEDMERAIIQYARHLFLAGKDFEKPTAPEFYRDFLPTSIGFEDVSLLKLIQHMKTIKKSYMSAIEWRNKTGEGVLLSHPEDGLKTVEDELQKRCKYFKELDEILGSKPQVNPPFLHHSSALQQEMEDREIFESLEYEENSSELNSEVPSSDTVESKDDDDELNTLNSTQVSQVPKTAKRRIEKQSEIIKKKYRRSPIKSAASALDSAMKARVAAEEKRLAWEIEFKTTEAQEKKEASQVHMEMEKMKLEFEREKWKSHLEQQKVIEDRKYEMEISKFKDKSEIAKLKIEKEFELEKLRIQSKSK